MSLPSGWATAKLGEICELLNGRAYSRTELLDKGKYPVLRVGNFFSNTHWYFSDLELDEDKYCDNGDLLYAWSASFGPKVWGGGKVIYHYHIWRTRPDDRALEKKFLCYWFEWDKENIKAEHGTGSTMIHVTKGDMEARALDFPPLAEQRRIVDKLDALFARLTRAREELDRVVNLSKKAREAFYSQAFAPLTGHVLKLDSVLEDIRYGTAKKCDYGNGVPVLRIPNIAGGRISTDDLKRADFEDEELTKLSLRRGDVLVVRSNGSQDLVGRSAVVDDAAVGMLYAGYLIRLRLDESKLLPDYLHAYLASPYARQTIEALARSTSGVNNINAEQLKSLMIPAAALEVQRSVISAIQSANAHAGRLEVEVARACALLDRLEAAILSKAFRGELVPQDPNDAPAGVLLERIRAQRATAPPVSKRRAGRRLRSAAG